MTLAAVAVETDDDNAEAIAPLEAALLIGTTVTFPTCNPASRKAEVALARV